MGNFSALIVFLLCFVVPLLSPTLRRDRSLLMASYLSLALRDSIALINAFVTPILTSWGDLYRFHNIGAGLDPEPGQPYGEFLRIVYHLFGTSFWLGEQLSILAYTFSLLLFVEIAILVGARQKLLGCLLVFGCLPSPAIHCSVTLRESYQVLAFLGSAYALLRLRAGVNTWAWLLLLSSLLLMITMHQGLAPYAMLLLLAGIPWALQGRGHLGAVIGLLCLTLVPMLLPRLVDRLADHSLVADMINEGKILEYAANYRNLVSEARSDYGLKIETDDPFAFIATSLGVIAMYFIAPLPWQVSRPIDYYAFVEVLVRLILLVGFLGQLKTQQGETRHRIIFLFSMSLFLEGMWAVATTNWGTSLRHHVVAFGGFVLAGLPYFAGLTLDKAHDELLLRRAQRGDHPLENRPAQVDLRALAAWLRTYRRLFITATLVCVLLIGAVASPPRLTAADLKPPYVSTGSLLLSPGRVLNLGILSANTYNRSDLGIWLSTEEIFQNFLERQRFQPRLEARLLRIRPDLASYSRALQVIPRYSQVREVNLYDGSSDVELDYAQVEISGESGVTRQLRATRLEVIGSGPSPEGAEKVTREAMEVLQKILAEAATRRISAQRKTIEGYLRVGLRRLERAEKGLSKRRRADPLELERINRARLALEGQCRRLRRDLEALERQRQWLGRDPDRVGPSAGHEVVQRLEQERIQAQQIYRPDSLTLQEIEERLVRARALTSQRGRASSQKLESAMLSSIRAKQALLREYEVELTQLKEKEPSSRLLQEFRDREKELMGWHQEYLVWERQLLAARIEERLCQGDGIALPLRAPLPGVRGVGAKQEFLQRYRRLLGMLPLAPLMGLIAVTLAHLAAQTGNISTKVAHFLDAPVVVELPSIPPRHRRAWKAFVTEGCGETCTKAVE